MVDNFMDAGNATRLTAWLQENVLDWPDGLVTATRLSGGSSASIFRISAADRDAILRAPQLPLRKDSVRALNREARVLRALANTDVPHPHFIAYHEYDDVLGVPFLLTELIDGWVGAEPPVEFSGVQTQAASAFSLVDGLALLHKVDYNSVGLGSFGRPEGFLDRQVEQWIKLFAAHKCDPAKPYRDLPDVALIADWLSSARPIQNGAALIHCDASFSNVMFHYDRPVRLAAFIDWEIATLGDPLLDLGRMAYPFPDERGLPGVSMMIDHSAGPTRQALASRYAEQSGMPTAALDYYMVLAMFKLAALIEPNYARHKMGLDPSGFAGRISEFALDLLRGARAIID